MPLLVMGPSCGHDFDFHLQSWLAVKAAWQGGLVAPQWVAAANYGAGEPRLLFYPPLSWLLGAGLGLVLPWAVVPIAFTGLCLAGAAAAMWGLAKRFTGGAAAAASAVVYALSPYLLFNAYERTAYAELLAAVWFPLLLRALLPGLAGKLEWRRRDAAGLAVSVAALWLTNAPSGVMGSYVVGAAALFMITRGLWRRGWPERLRGEGRVAAAVLLAAVAGCLLAGDYLFPAWYSERFVEIARAVGPGMRVEDSFLFGHTGEPFHDQVLRTASWIGIATVSVAFAAGLAILARRSRKKLPGLTGVLSFLLLLVGGCALLQLPWSLPVWHVLPELGFLQFPWRLLLPVSAAGALLVGLAVEAAGDFSRGGWKAVVLGAAVLGYAAGMTVWAAQSRYQACDDEDRVPAQVALLAPGLGFEGTDEYTPRGADNGEIQQGLPEVRLLSSAAADEGDDSAAANPAWRGAPAGRVAGMVRVQQWPSAEHPERLLVRIVAQTAGYAVLRLERFPDWEMLVNGQPCGAACGVREDGLVTVRIPAQTTVIAGRYRDGLDAPWDVWTGRGLSLLGLVWTLGLWRRIGRASGSDR